MSINDSADNMSESIGRLMREVENAKDENATLRKQVERLQNPINLIEGDTAKDMQRVAKERDDALRQLGESESAINMALISLHCAKASALIAACKTADKDEIIGSLDDAIDGLEKHESTIRSSK